MPARKIRVELFDSDGNRYTIAFEGQVTRDKALRLLDLVELLGGMPGEEGTSGLTNISSNKKMSRFDKVQLIIQKSFPLVWFSSKDIQSTYEQKLKEPITLSTVSTYLARLTNRGILLRIGKSNNLKYRVKPSITQSAIKKQVS